MKKDLEKKIHQFALQMHLDGYINGFEKGYKQGLDDTIKIGEWIPVSERLPEINDDVLISLEWGIDIGRYSGGEWCSEWINNYDDGNVYAWMPLPEPYEPQESEDKE